MAVSGRVDRPVELWSSRSRNRTPLGDLPKEGEGGDGTQGTGGSTGVGLLRCRGGPLPPVFLSRDEGP